MNAGDRAILLGLLVAAGLRLLDYVLPPGRHWTFLDRWSKDDDDPTEKE